MKNEFNYEKSFLSSNILDAIFDNMDVYLCVSDIRTDEILFINNKMKQRYGLDSDSEVTENICGKTFRTDFEKNLEKKSGFSPVKKLTEDPDSPKEIVVWEEYNPETGRYYKNVSSVVQWDDGRKAHLFYSTDITDAKLAENSLKKQLEQQELMSAVSQSFTTMKDTQHLMYEALKMSGEFMNVNQSFLAQYKKDEGCLECIYEWCDEESTPYIGKESRWPISPDMDIYKDLMTIGHASVSDYTLLTHPNFQTIKDYNLRAFLNIPIEIAGEFWGVIGFIINTHSYDWSESDIYLGKLIAGVFSVVISRNAAEENLLKSKETAEHASKSKGDFLSIMSHEMRTPMNAIIGMTQIAKKSEDLQKMEYCLDRIETASKHLLGLINDILDISKIEVNKLELSPVEYDFEKMLRNIAGVVNFRAEDKKQNLIINIDNDLPSAFIGDEMRLSQVIVNLLSNAIKFTPDGGTITLNVRNSNAHDSETEDGISTVLFEVIDTGIGISEEQKSRLFTPFEQATGGISRKYGGTGLGLTISKGIVELMEGHIWIESELGKGSKFSFTVKMKAGRGLPKLQLSDKIIRDDIRILAVTGIPVMKDYLIRAFSELGLSCDIAGNETAALKMTAENIEHPYNIFLIDWRTQDTNEFNLIKKIKRLGYDNTVILVTSETDWSNFEKSAVSAGVSMFIFKPLFLSSIVNAINESLGEAADAKKTSEENHTYDFEGYTLLIAEDIEINREIISAVLEDTKISIDFASDGIEAVSLFVNNPLKYSLILMDIHMPEMDGYEATKNIRSAEAEGRMHIPIIAMTADVFREDIDKCIEAGMDDHLGKPLDTSNLLSKLESYLISKV